MTPQKLGQEVIREVPSLRSDQPVGEAVGILVDSGLPALPVEAEGQLVGIFGEREFIAAIFPGYVGELKFAGFVKKATDEVLAKRASCLLEPVSQYMNTEHVDVLSDYSDLQLAEIFLHHRVLIVPVVDDRRVAGVITRSDFFRALAAKIAT